MKSSYYPDISMGVCRSQNWEIIDRSNFSLLAKMSAVAQYLGMFVLRDNLEFINF